MRSQAERAAVARATLSSLCVLLALVLLLWSPCHGR